MVYLHYLASVSKPEHPSERIVEQRMRNRAMEALEALSEGDEGVRSVGVGEFVEQFFDIINDDIPWRWRTWSCFTSEEVERLDAVHSLLVAACDATPQITTDVEASLHPGGRADFSQLPSRPSPRCGKGADSAKTSRKRHPRSSDRTSA